MVLVCNVLGSLGLLELFEFCNELEMEKYLK